MRAVIMTVVVAFCAAGCGLSPTQACKEIVATTCDKIFTCYTTTQEMDAIKLIYGSNVAECKTKFESTSRCAQENPCDSGKTYDATAAATCVNEYKALSCDDVKNASSSPSSCTESSICK